MKVNTKSYPHPVLGNEDDLGGSFSVEFRYELGKEDITLHPEFVLKNSGIEELIKKEKASFIAEVECRSTFFRKSFSSRKDMERFAIPAPRLRERVLVSFYVCADQDIRNYKPHEPHLDYEGAVFDIEAGDVLAIGGYCSFIAEKSFDPLRPPVSSFMTIQSGNWHEGSMQVDYDCEKITIYLSKDDWRNYLDVRGQKLTEGILHSAIVFPVLVDAVHQIRNGGDDYESMNWYGRLEAILDAKGLRDKSPFEAAQKILENPLNRSFQGISSLLDTPNDQNYE